MAPEVQIIAQSSCRNKNYRITLSLWNLYKLRRDKFKLYSSHNNIIPFPTPSSSFDHFKLTKKDAGSSTAPIGKAGAFLGSLSESAGAREEEGTAMFVIAMLLVSPALVGSFQILSLTLRVDEDALVGSFRIMSLTLKTDEVALAGGFEDGGFGLEVGAGEGFEVPIREEGVSAGGALASAVALAMEEDEEAKGLEATVAVAVAVEEEGVGVLPTVEEPTLDRVAASSEGAP